MKTLKSFQFYVLHDVGRRLPKCFRFRARWKITTNCRHRRRRIECPVGRRRALFVRDADHRGARRPRVPKEFRAGGLPEFSAIDKNGERLPDGVYTYELRLSPVLSAAAKEKLAAARGKDDDSEEVRATRKREVPPAMVQSGSFSITNGSVIVAGSAEEGQGRVSKVTTQPLPALSARSTAATKTLQHHPRMISSPDDVIPDDLIVQGSACVGLDCVSGEVFGFDTIRLKENNTRLQFEDTSAAGFPLNNWQIRANSSGAGGASFLAFVDQGAAGNSETGTIVFEVDAGAPANSLKVASNGKVGLRTATPVLDVHANTSDTPAIRLEQNNSGGFAAQTWDIAGNEANFFVRDVTGGSRLPFRIRPGAPTSSIDISASGNVGIATQSPGTSLDVAGNTLTLGSEAGTAVRGEQHDKIVQTRYAALRVSKFAICSFCRRHNPDGKYSCVWRRGRWDVGCDTN